MLRERASNSRLSLLICYLLLSTYPRVLCGKRVVNTIPDVGLSFHGHIGIVSGAGVAEKMSAADAPTNSSVSMSHRRLWESISKESHKVGTLPGAPALSVQPLLVLSPPAQLQDVPARGRLRDSRLPL